MKTFAELTPARRKWVLLVQQFFPTIAERGTITYKELHDVHDYFLSKRSDDSTFNVGFPIWIIQSCTISRGVYRLPLDASVSLSDVMEDNEVERKAKEYLTNVARRYKIEVPLTTTHEDVSNV